MSLVKENSLSYYKVGEGDKVLKQSPQAGTALGDTGLVILYTEVIDEDKVEVPNIMDYFASDANILLANAGLNIKVKGGTIGSKDSLVTSQSPPAGTMVPRGSMVEVGFNRTTNVH